MNKLFDKDTIDKLNRFEVDLPQNDWEVLSGKMQMQKNRVIPLWLYRIAAGITILLSVGAFMIVNQKSDSTEFIAESNTNVENSSYNVNTDKILPDNEDYQSLGIAKKDITINATKDNYNLKRVNSNKKNKHNKSELKAQNQESILTLNHNDMTANIGNSYSSDDENKKTSNSSSQKNKKNKKDKENNNYKSLEEYIKDIENKKEQKNINNRDKAKEKRHKLKEDTSFKRNYLASANISSTAPYSTNRNHSANLNGAGGMSSTISPYDIETKHYIPISFGMEIGIPIYKKLYINTGITYSYLLSKTSYLEKITHIPAMREYQELHYLGVPLYISYNFLESKIVDIYLSTGGKIEKGIKNITSIKRYNQNNDISTKEKNKYNIKGVQTALGIKAGVNTHITKNLGIYLESGMEWNIPSKKYPQPESKRTEHPLFIDIKAGIRWIL